MLATNSTGLEFVASFSKVLDLGFKSYLNTKEEDEKETEENENNSHLASFKQGGNANFKEIKLIEYETKPKQLYTFATLLKDLTSVTKYVKNLDIKKLLQEKDKDKKGESGRIGTPATRDAIIKTLIDRKFMVEEKGKLVTTQLGKDFLNCLPDNAKQPDMTALWAEKQTEIKQGNLSVEEFLSEIDLFVKQEISNLKNNTIVINSGGNNEKKKVQKGTIMGISQKQIYKAVRLAKALRLLINLVRR